MIIPQLSLTTAQINAYLAFVTASPSWEVYSANTNPNKLPTTSFALLTPQSAVEFLLAIANSVLPSNVNSSATSIILSQFLNNMRNAQLSALKLSSLPYVPAGYPSYVDDPSGLMAWVLSKASIANLSTRVIQSVPYGQSVNDGYVLNEYLSLEVISNLGLNAFNASVTVLSGNLSVAQIQSLNREQLIAYFQPWLANINLPANASTKTARMGFLKTLAWDYLTFEQRAYLSEKYTTGNVSVMDQWRAMMTSGMSLVNTNPLDAIITPYINNLNKWSDDTHRSRYANGLMNDVLNQSKNAFQVKRLSESILRKIYETLSGPKKGKNFGVLDMIFNASSPVSTKRFGVTALLTYTKADGTALFSREAVKSLDWEFLRTYPKEELTKISLHGWNAILAKMSYPTGSTSGGMFQISPGGVGGGFKYGNLGIFPNFLYGILLGDPSSFNDQLLDRHAGFGAVGYIFSADYLNSMPRANIGNFSAVVLNSISITTSQALCSDFCEALSLSVMPALNAANADVILRKLTANFYNNLTDAQMAVLNLSFMHFPYMSAATVNGLNANFFNRIAPSWVVGLNYAYLSGITKPEVILGLKSSFLNAISADVAPQLQVNLVNNLSLQAFLSTQFLTLTSAQINTSLNVFKVSNNLADTARLLLVNILNELTSMQIIGDSTSSGLDRSLVSVCLLVADIPNLSTSFIGNLFALYKNKGGDLPLTAEQMHALTMPQVNAIFMNYGDMSAQIYTPVPDSILSALTGIQLGMVDPQVWAHCVASTNINHGRRLAQTFDQQVNSLIDEFNNAADKYYHAGFWATLFGSSEERRIEMRHAWTALSQKLNSFTVDKILSGNVVSKLIDIANNPDYGAFSPADYLIPRIPFLNLTSGNFTSDQLAQLLVFAGQHAGKFSLAVLKSLTATVNSRAVLTALCGLTNFEDNLINRLNLLSNTDIAFLGGSFFNNLPNTVKNNLKWSSISGWGELNVLAALNYVTGETYPDAISNIPNLVNYLSAMHFDDAWNAGFTGKGMTIAVIDSGIEKQNPYIKTHIDNRSKNFMSDNGTGNDIVPSDYADSVGHGTWVAGLIAGEPIGFRQGNGSEIRIRGGAYEAKVLALRAGNMYGAAATAVINSIDYAVNMGVKVINISGGIPIYDMSSKTDVLSLVLKKAKDNNVLIVVAAGNEGYSTELAFNLTLAQQYSNILAVGATQYVNNVFSYASSYSNQAISQTPYNYIDAVGTDVFMYADQSGTTQHDGTSFSVPFVAAAAALLLQAKPNLKPEDIIYALTRTATSLHPNELRRLRQTEEDASVNSLIQSMSSFDVVSGADTSNVSQLDLNSINTLTAPALANNFI